MLKKLTALAAAAVLGAFLAGCKGEGKKDEKGASGWVDLGAKETMLVEEYDVLAKAILKVHPNETEAQKQKELQLMADLLSVYKGQAENAFAAIKASEGAAQGKAIDSAIIAVTKLAQEGDKRVNDIKLGLQKGGHHHTKAEDSDEEYIYINSKAKKDLMAQAEILRVLKASGKPATPAEIDVIAKDVFATVAASMKKKT